MSLGFQAMDEQVIVQCQALRAGEEVKSDLGIIIESKKAIPEVPISGAIVSVGENCPEWVHDLVGCEIALPVGQAAGVMVNVPDPDVVAGRLPRNSNRARILVAMHYKAIRVVYEEVTTLKQSVVTSETTIKSGLSSLKGI